MVQSRDHLSEVALLDGRMTQTQNHEARPGNLQNPAAIADVVY